MPFVKITNMSNGDESWYDAPENFGFWRCREVFEWMRGKGMGKGVHRSGYSFVADNDDAYFIGLINVNWPMGVEPFFKINIVEDR